MVFALVYTTPDCMTAASSLLVVYGVAVIGGATALVLAAARLFHHLSMRAQDRAAEREKPVLQQGRAVLTGAVELDDPAVAAVRIRVEEQGREWHTKNGWQHEWRETGRTVVVNPFHLVLDGGERVRVAPDERVFLVDALSTVERAGLQRTRQAELTQGEQVTIAGRLVWGHDGDRAGGGVYRDAGASLTLQAPRGEQMLVSAGSLAARHTPWIRFYTATVTLLALAIAVVNLGFGDFHRLQLTGQRVSLAVALRNPYTTTYKGRTTQHYQIDGLYPLDGGPVTHHLTVEVSADAYASCSRGGGEAPFIVVPGAPEVHQIGYAPTIHKAGGMMVTVGALVALFLFAIMRRNQVPWYEQERVVERGSGKLDP